MTAKQQAKFDAAKEAHQLIGWRAYVSKKTGKGIWFVEVSEYSLCGTFVKVIGSRMFGLARWVRVSDLQDPKPPIEE